MNKKNKKIYCDRCKKEILNEYYSGDEYYCIDCAEELDIVPSGDGDWYTYSDYTQEFYMDDDLSDIPQFYLEKVENKK